MIAILSKVPSVEDIFVAELKTYFDQMRFGELYPNFPTIRITLEHPFAVMWQQANGNSSNTYDGSLFPSITLASGSDSKPGQLSGLNSLESISVVKADITGLAATGLQAAPGAIEWMTEYFKTNTIIHGRQGTANKSDQVAIDIWSESIQLKNDIYGLLMMYLSGPKRSELELTHAITIFDGTVRGQRSGNYNMDFGQLLYGAHIDFQIDYRITQAILDTEYIPGII